MDDALRDALVVEMGDLLAQQEVLEQRRPTRVRLQRILVVGDDDTLIRRQQRPSIGRLLMQLAAGAGCARLHDLRRVGFGSRHSISPAV